MARREWQTLQAGPVPVHSFSFSFSFFYNEIFLRVHSRHVLAIISLSRAEQWHENATRCYDILSINFPSLLPISLGFVTGSTAGGNAFWRSGQSELTIDVCWLVYS